MGQLRLRRHRLGLCQGAPPAGRCPRDIYSNQVGFTAKKADGSMIAWGLEASSEVNKQIAVDVRCIYPAEYAFAALKIDGSVVAWGNKFHGGDCGKAQSQLVDVQHIYATERAFAALKAVWLHWALAAKGLKPWPAANKHS